jgi:hypothetical protein
MEELAIALSDLLNVVRQEDVCEEGSACNGCDACEAYARAKYMADTAEDQLGL